MTDFRRIQTQFILGALSFSLLACNVISSGVPQPTAASANPTAGETESALPLISQSVTLISVPTDESNPGSNFPPYTITAQTPQLSGSDDPRVLAFNQRLNGLVANEVDMWKQNFQQLPLTPLSNGSSLNVSYTLVSQTDDLWSFKFDSSFYADTAAHPGLNSITLNYDLGQGRELALGDLFLPGSNYLVLIANYCAAELQKQPYADSFFMDGAQPLPENYRNWNITPNGLMITFDEYQVAPYAAGPQTVIIPYAELSALIDPQGPLANFLP